MEDVMKRWTATSGVSKVKITGPTAAVWVAVISLMIAGCAEAGSSLRPGNGSGPAQAAAASSPGTAPGKSGPSETPGRFKVAKPDGSTWYPGVGAVVWPAPAGAQPSVSQQHAIAALESGDTAPQRLGGQRPSSLRLVEYENVFGPRSADGKETPSVPKQLAWFAEYDNVDHAVSLPGGAGSAGSSSGPTSAVSSGWVAIVVISATTGKVIDAFDYSGM